MKSLGDDTPDYVVVQETHPMPSGRKNLLAALDNLMAGGGVQKFTVEMGHPIKLSRAVPKAEAAKSDFPAALLGGPEDLWSAARNAHIDSLDFKAPEKAFHYLWLAFNVLASKDAIPKAILVPQKRQFAEWLKVDEVGDSFFGAKVVENKNIPDETLLLVGADMTDVEQVSFSLRIEMVVPSLHRKEQ